MTIDGFITVHFTRHAFQSEREGGREETEPGKASEAQALGKTADVREALPRSPLSIIKGLK